MTEQLDSRWYVVDNRPMHALVGTPAHGRPGDPIVMAHGLGVAAESLRFLGAELVANGRRSFAPDLPGFGLSGTHKPPHPLRIPGLADALRAWMETAGVQRAALYGNSIGAQIAADLAARHPDRVSALVLVGPTPDPDARTLPAQVWRWLKNLPRDRSAAGQGMLRGYWRAGFLRVARSFQYAVQDRIEEKLPRIRVPTLVVGGSRDPIAPLHWVRYVCDLVPNGRLVVVEGAAHSIHGSHPERLAAEMTSFLDEAAR